jgi:arsenic resistance protein ArsH
MSQVENKESTYKNTIPDSQLLNHTVQSVVSELFSRSKTMLFHPPKILLLYGSLRKVSYSRLLAEEAARILTSFGAEVQLFHPEGLLIANIELTQLNDETLLPKKVQELRQLVGWCEAMVWQ